MGVAYKLKEEVKDFIIQEKKANPHLSCRNMGEHIKVRFNINLSKSSINALIKEAGLSAPIGRKPKKKKPHISMPVLPVLLENPPELPKIEFRIEKEIVDRAVLEVEKDRLAKEAAAKELIKQEEFKKAQEEEKRKAVEEIECKKREELERARREAEQEAKEAEEKRKQGEAEALRIEKEKWDKIAREEAARKTKEAIPDTKLDLLPELENSGLVLLAAADYLLGGSSKLSALVHKVLAIPAEVSGSLIKNLLYSSVLPQARKDMILKPLATHLNNCKQADNLETDALNILITSLEEVRAIKFILPEGESAYFDGQLYSVWSTPNIPYDFSDSLYNIKKTMNRYFYGNHPFVFFNAPGYDIPSSEFFRLMLSLNSVNKSISGLIFYGNKLEELERFSLSLGKKYNFIFGLWPWQFKEFRKVSKIGEFRQLRLSFLERDFYAADIDILFLHPEIKDKFSLRGIALKLSPTEKTRLVILTNAANDIISPEGLAAYYFNRWPNLEEAFQDYSQKTELFTYTASSQKYFSGEAISLLKDAPVEGIDFALSAYLKVLDLYVKRYFMPHGYEGKGFQSVKEIFYDLPVSYEKGSGECRYIVFKPGPNYGFLKDLEYAVRRLNEKEIKGEDGLRIYFKKG